MADFSEKELIDGIKKGAKNAFGKVFEHFYKGLCAYSYTFLKSHEASEEIVQDFFAELWESQALRNVDISLKLYLYRSIHNKCVNYLKSLAVNRVRLEKYAKYMQEETELLNIDTESDMFENFFSEGFEKDVNEAIDSLAQQQKQIFTLSRFQQKTYSEIATELDISINSVKTQMSRALQKLRASLIEKMKARETSA